MKTTSHNFHVPLPEDLYRLLRAEAERRQQPATALARHAIARWLQQCEQEALHHQIQAYAEEHAGTAADFDADLEQAAVEYLLDKGQEA
jgi:ribosomal 50S subunit-associated protein YjgA (DUF615 family)